MSEFRFEERHPHESGFSALYEQKIAPFLRTTEKQRLAARLVGSKRLKLVAGVAVALIVLVNLLPTTGEGSFTVIILFLAAFAAVVVWATAGKKVNDTVAEHVRPVLLEFLGDVQFIKEPPSDFIDIRALSTLGLLRDYKYEKFSQGLEGMWRGTRYRIAGVELKRRGKNQDVTIFNGIALSVEAPQAMPTIVFHADRENLGGVTKTLLKFTPEAGKGLERLHFPDQEVEAVYDVYTDDVARAQEVLEPSFGQTLMSIARDTKGGDNAYISAAFLNRAFVAALDGRTRAHPWMDLDAFSAPLSQYDERLHAVLSDMTMIRRVIDLLIDGTSSGAVEGTRD